MRGLSLVSMGIALTLGVTACGGGSGSSSSSTPPPNYNDTTVKKFTGLDGARVAVKPGAASGYVDSVTAEKGAVKLTGWAASSDFKQTVNEVTGVVGGKAVVEAKPSVERPDVVEAYGSKALKRAGFELQVPTKSLKCSAPQAGLTVFGSLHGVGSALEFVEETSKELSDAC